MVEFNIKAKLELAVHGVDGQTSRLWVDGADSVILRYLQRKYSIASLIGRSQSWSLTIAIFPEKLERDLSECTGVLTLYLFFGFLFEFSAIIPE